jgi:ABC-2 type transport system ATP-binding protein
MPNAVTTPAIEVHGLTRTFTAGSTVVRALDDVTFSVAPGECVALLGVNGAGKTTLAKVLSTLLLPTEGGARIAGFDVVKQPREVRARLAVVFGGDRGLYSMLTGRENLEYFGMLAGVGRRDLRVRVPELLAEVGLDVAADRRVEGYSKGMKQRLHIAAGLIGDPEVLLLDEPTVGLDPTEAQRLRGQIGELVGRGITVLLTSHYLLDVERLASRVLLIDHGRLTHDMSLREFAAVAGYEAAVVVTVGDGAADVIAHKAADLGGITVAQVDRAGGGGNSRVTLLVEHWRPEILVELGEALAGVSIADMQVRAAGLEEAFVALTKGGPA